MTPTDRRLLDFESRGLQGAVKRGAIIRELGMKPSRYQQTIQRLLQTREALEIAPMTVHRWERAQAVSEARRARRTF